jgi:hypothetical protein
VVISQPDKADPGAWRPSSMPATARVQLPERIRVYLPISVSRNVGDKIELRFDGKVLVETVIREPVAGGSLYISEPDWTNVMASDLAKQISKPGAKIEVISK